MINKIKNNKSASLAVILLVYLLAIAVAVTVFLFTADFDAIWRFLMADVAATITIFIFGAILKNSSVYDPYWSVAPPLLLFGAMLHVGNLGLFAILMLAVICIWSIRLTANWVYTFDNLSWVDWRYKKYQNQSGKLWQLVNFFGIMLMPTLIVFGAMTPLLTSVSAIPLSAVVPPLGYPEPNLLTWVAAVLAIGATALEWLSDIQMHGFRKDPQNAGKSCDVGLWRLSRHPNYLGEISFWWAVYFAVLSVNTSLWWTGFGALANTLLFVFVSIPLMETRQTQRRPDYADYRRETSMLLLLPPRKLNECEESEQVQNI